MRLIREISFDEVIQEWLKAESYKIPNMPTLEGLKAMRPDVVNPLEALSVNWYVVEIESEDDFNNIRIIKSGDWQECTGGSFSVIGLPENIHFHTDHHKDILSKKAELEAQGKFKSKVIMFGRDIYNPTVIEGNHRIGAYTLLGNESGFGFLPLEVIIGLSPESHKYYWSWD